MKLIVFCLFTIYCCSLVKASTMEHKKLKEVLRELKMLKSNLPDCCCLTALTCFRETLLEHFGISGKYQKKLYKSLNHTLTISGLNFCNTETSTTNCSTCHSHPKENASEFFNRLESLVQRVRLFQIYFRKLYIKY
uniref:Interleukin n=1 Tax=Neolamprologus brichardi TaxID=32507 RepID=A0A3Q4HDM1_NEOBR